jgi:ABC-2 type transport system ATP-binding protein
MLSRPTEGTARVAGHDVIDDPAGVRASIGVAAQAATVDGLLTAEANLEMPGRRGRAVAAHRLAMRSRVTSSAGTRNGSTR